MSFFTAKVKEGLSHRRETESTTDSPLPPFPPAPPPPPVSRTAYAYYFVSISVARVKASE